MSKILVIGHTVLDIINFKNNSETRPGGIYHTINTFANIIGKDDQIYLTTLFPEENFELYKYIYDKVNLDFSSQTKSIPTVTLNLFDDKERYECHHKVAKKLTLSPLIEYKQFDSILINMISGYDINIDDISHVRKKSNCKIYFDVHSMARRLNIDGERKFKKIGDIELWLENIDIIQMNENEMWSLFGRIEKTEIVKKVFSHGVEIVLITKGENGAEMFLRNGEYLSINALDISAVNVVGCGDAFGASFLYKFIQTNNPKDALTFANTTAGLTTTYKSLNDYERLKDDTARKLN